MEYIIKFLAKIVGFDLASLVVYVTIFNALIYTCQSFLDGVSKVLNQYKDQTKTDIDNKAVVIVGSLSGYLSKALEFLSKILDVVGSNKKH